MREISAFLCLVLLVFMSFVGGSADAVCAESIEISIVISPKVIVFDSQSTWLTVHTDIALSDVDTGSIKLNDLAVSWTKADARGNLVAKFDINEVKAIVAPDEAAFVLTGLTTEGVPFSGTEIVPVRETDSNR
jgi:hypothetical protein